MRAIWEERQEEGFTRISIQQLATSHQYLLAVDFWLFIPTGQGSRKRQKIHDIGIRPMSCI